MRATLTRYLVFTTRILVKTRALDLKEIKSLRNGRTGRRGSFKIESAKFG